jgi:hypothetical protein
MSTLKSLVFWGGLLAALFFGAVLTRLAWTDHLGAEVVLPLLAIGGIVCLLMALTLVAIVFAKAGLADKSQALALPEGSVRAVLALGLVVIFAIVTVYLFGSLDTGGGDVAVIQVETADEARALQDRAARPESEIEILSVNPSLDAKAKTSSENKSAASNKAKVSGAKPATSPPMTSDQTLVPMTSEGPGSAAEQADKSEQPKGPFTIRYRHRTSQQAADFAKQLLVLIGTLVTSVSSFYFGTRAVESAKTGGATGPDQPAISTVNPAQINLNAAVDPIPVSILGSGLDQTMQIKMAQPGKTVTGTVVGSATASKVEGTFPKTSLTAGDWDVEVSTAKGVTARHPITIT